MPHVTFVTPQGAETLVEGLVGQSVMELARRAGIAEIVAECGGSCACATCHVYVDPAWQARTGAPGPDEADMLDFVQDRTPQSRLSCQIRLRPELDGLAVHLPARQR